MTLQQFYRQVQFHRYVQGRKQAQGKEIGYVFFYRLGVGNRVLQFYRLGLIVCRLGVGRVGNGPSYISIQDIGENSFTDRGEEHYSRCRSFFTPQVSILDIQGLGGGEEIGLREWMVVIQTEITAGSKISILSHLLLFGGIIYSWEMVFVLILFQILLHFSLRNSIFFRSVDFFFSAPTHTHTARARKNKK